MNDMLYCEICGEKKVNTGPHEATCGSDRCLEAKYGPPNPAPPPSKIKKN